MLCYAHPKTHTYLSIHACTQNTQTRRERAQLLLAAWGASEMSEQAQDLMSMLSRYRGEWRANQ